MCSRFKLRVGCIMLGMTLVLSGLPRQVRADDHQQGSPENSDSAPSAEPTKVPNTQSDSDSDQKWKETSKAIQDALGALTKEDGTTPQYSKDECQSLMDSLNAFRNGEQLTSQRLASLYDALKNLKVPGENFDATVKNLKSALDKALGDRARAKGDDAPGDQKSKSLDDLLGKLRDIGSRIAQAFTGGGQSGSDATKSSESTSPPTESTPPTASTIPPAEAEFPAPPAAPAPPSQPAASETPSTASPPAAVKPPTSVGMHAGAEEEEEEAPPQSSPLKPAPPSKGAAQMEPPSPSGGPSRIVPPAAPAGSSAPGTGSGSISRGFSPSGLAGGLSGGGPSTLPANTNPPENIGSPSAPSDAVSSAPSDRNGPTNSSPALAQSPQPSAASVPGPFPAPAPSTVPAVSVAQVTQPERETTTTAPAPAAAAPMGSTESVAAPPPAQSSSPPPPVVNNPTLYQYPDTGIRAVTAYPLGTAATPSAPAPSATSYSGSSGSGGSSYSSSTNSGVENFPGGTASKRSDEVLVLSSGTGASSSDGDGATPASASTFRSATRTIIDGLNAVSESLGTFTGGLALREPTTPVTASFEERAAISGSPEPSTNALPTALMLPAKTKNEDLITSALPTATVAQTYDPPKGLVSGLDQPADTAAILDRLSGGSAMAVVSAGVFPSGTGSAIAPEKPQTSKSDLGSYLRRPASQHL